MKILDLTQQINDFEGKPIPVGGSTIETQDGSPVALILELQAAETLKQALGMVSLRLKDNSEPMTLKRALLRYCQTFNRMGLSEEDQTTLYEVGMLIGAAGGKLELTQAQYDALKRMTDAGRLKLQGQPDEDVFAPVIKFAVKKMVDNALRLDENTAPEPKEKKGK